MSKGAAHYRKTAAELIQRFPEVLEPLTDGRVCITTVVELARVITPENRAEILPRFFHASREEAKELAAEIRPVENPPRREVVTALPAAVASALALGAPALPLASGSTAEPPHAKSDVPVGAPAPASAPPPAVEVVPLTAELSRFHITVSRRLLAKLDPARDALSHSNPNASADEIIEAGLDLIIARAAKRHGLTDKPRKTPPPSRGDGIPAHVKRAVWERDGGRCTFRLANGEICGSTHQLELDHVVPKSQGGEPTIENTRIRCRFHNILEARRVLGDEVMDVYTAIGRGP